MLYNKIRIWNSLIIKTTRIKNIYLYIIYMILNSLIIYSKAIPSIYHSFVGNVIINTFLDW